MWDFSIGGAVGAMKRTAPFILLRIVVYFGVAVLYLIATSAGGAIGLGFGSFGDAEAQGAGAVWGALIGFAGASGILWLAREYILYIVKAGHIAVLVRVYDGQDFPGGRGQIDYAAAIVKQHFGQASVLFAVDQAVKGVLRVITGIIGAVAIVLPIPGLAAIARIINAILRMSVTYVDEIILAHNLRTGSTNPWETSRHALVLYAQNYMKFLKNAVWLWLFMWLITLAIFLVFVGPAMALLALVPGSVGFFAFVTTVITAWAFKAALLEPFALYALMQVYFKTIEGQVPDPEWDGKLAGASKKFQDMLEKARDYAPPAAKPGPPRGAPAGDLGAAG
jgi:hypothetical protein